MKTLLLIHASVIFSGSVLAAECPLVPSPPPVSDEERLSEESWQWFAEPYSIYQYHGHHDKTPLGVGHLRVEYTNQGYYDWPRRIVLPIWDSPDGAVIAWIRNGLILTGDGKATSPLSGLGTVETDYEHSTFVVSQVDRDWFQLRYKDGSDGLGWVHRCALSLGETSLTYQSWQSLLKEKGDWLHFRSRVPHILRDAPSIESDRVTVIGLNHRLKLLLIQGDWMQVEVAQPDQTCNGPEQTSSGTVHTGWVKWRDDLMGPWVWYYTRGC